MAKPIPLAPPVTMAECPSSRNLPDFAGTECMMSSRNMVT
jgi:hypothetical protein